MDDELLVRLKLEEEMNAINGDFQEQDNTFAFNLHSSLEDEDPSANNGNNGNKKVVLEEWPEIIDDNLSLRVKKYKDHAVKRKSSFKATEDRLKEESCTGQEKLVLSYAYLAYMKPSRTVAILFSSDRALLSHCGSSCFAGLARVYEVFIALIDESRLPVTTHRHSQL